jgi:hypothetical protein
MVYHLNLLHLMLAAGALVCAYLALREVRRVYVSQWRLFVPPLLAGGIAFGLMLLQLAADRPRWMFAATLLAGLAIGGVRGFTMQVEFDVYRPRIHSSPTAKRLLFLVALIVVGCVAVEIVGTVVEPQLDRWRYASALLATLCAGMMLGRAAAIAGRLRHAHWD